MQPRQPHKQESLSFFMFYRFRFPFEGGGRKHNKKTFVLRIFILTSEDVIQQIGLKVESSS